MSVNNEARVRLREEMQLPVDGERDLIDNHRGQRGKLRSSVRIAVVIPAYKVREHVLSVLSQIGPQVQKIYVVDDCCPDKSGEFVQAENVDERVSVIFHKENQGVGGAFLSGVEAALQDQMDIIVKIDGDGQMSPELLPLFVEPIISGIADYTKGNRFYNPDDVRTMPFIRLIGNAGLSFMTKLSSGYWSIFDPTNGYIAIDARLAAVLPRTKIARRYFFETDMLFRCGLMRAKVVDIPMSAIYGDEVSNLRIHRELPRFFVGNMRNFLKRIFYNYFLRDFNIGSLELLMGLLLVIFGAGFAISEWGITAPATAGTVMIAALPLIAGIFLLISFINYDAQVMPKETISYLLPDPYRKT